MATFPLRCEDCHTVYDAPEDTLVRESEMSPRRVERVFCCDSCTTPTLPALSEVPHIPVFGKLLREPKVLAMESQLDDV